MLDQPATLVKPQAKKDPRVLRGAVICLSGGMDCSTLLFYAVEDMGIEKVAAISFRYGQTHAGMEIAASRTVWEAFKEKHPSAAVAYTEAALPIASLAPSNALIKGDIPDATSAPPVTPSASKRRRRVVVPGRNLLFASCAVAYAASLQYSYVLIGAVGTDSTDFPDCRPEFIVALDKTAFLGYKVHVAAPFAKWPKSKVVKYGLKHKVPYEKTYTCYRGGAVPCDRCQACVGRADAFSLNGVKDPLLKGITWFEGPKDEAFDAGPVLGRP